MAFIYEKIPTIDKEKYGFDKFRKKFVSKTHLKNIRRWIIDRERNIFLIQIKGEMPEREAIFGFYMEGNYYHIHAHKNYERDNSEQQKPVLTWHISGFRICEGAYGNKDKFISDIKEIFHTYGYHIQVHADDIERVNIKISNTVFLDH